MSYFLCPAGASLRGEVNDLFTKRDKRSDGWIGDPSHAARKSSHNPDYSQGGVVLGIDIDIDDNDPGRSLAKMVLDAVIGDERVWYVIHKGIIWSRTHGWRARKYYGNPHTGHIHVSFMEQRHLWRDTSRWIKPHKRQWKWDPEVKSDLAAVQVEFQKEAGHVDGPKKRYHGNAHVQNALNEKWLRPRGKELLKVDGWVGPETVAAMRDYERANVGKDRATTPDEVSLGGQGLQIMYRFK